MPLTIPSQFFGMVASALNKQVQPGMKINNPQALPVGLGKKIKLK